MVRTSTEGQTLVVPTTDGRELGVCQWGDLDGAPLFVLHRSPGSRFLRHASGAYVDRRLRVITYDRPGYGISTRMPGHCVADAAADIGSIADFLVLDRFGVAGVSGGGPRALAAAALLPDRVARCATVVSGAPFTARGLDFCAGMADDERAGWQAADENGEALDIDCAETLAWARADLPGVPFENEETAAILRATFREAFRQGVTGYRDDRLALVRDWGVRVEDVHVPVRVLVAREDTSVPRSHWDWLTGHLPEATLVPVPGNHFGPREGPELQLMAWVGHGSGDL